jgi:hypothetical protein
MVDSFVRGWDPAGSMPRNLSHKYLVHKAFVDECIVLEESGVVSLGLAGTVAFPFSPPETDRSPLYAFTLSHVVVPGAPGEMLRTVREEVKP